MCLYLSIFFTKSISQQNLEGNKKLDSSVKIYISSILPMNVYFLYFYKDTILEYSVVLKTNDN
jgi:hypothetical protein